MKTLLPLRIIKFFFKVVISIQVEKIMKKVLFYFGHPAHYHLFKNPINELILSGHKIKVVIKTKDILEDLLQTARLPYENLLVNRRKNDRLSLIMGEAKKYKALNKICMKFRPDIMAGTSSAIPITGRLRGIPSVIFSEDDFKIIRSFGMVTYPFTNIILSPITCDNGRWNKKTIKYNGFQKLAYLHPKRFSPDKKIVDKYLDTSKPYFLIRFSKLNAYHDKNMEGIDTKLAVELVNFLRQKGNVYISSEKTVPRELEKFVLKINPVEIHHIMAFANLFIGDSQSMAVESAMLGVPSIRYSSFARKIGILEELEKKYMLTFGLHPGNPYSLIKTVGGLLNKQKLKETFLSRRNAMLKEKIDVTAFIAWFIENYPQSQTIMKTNPDYQITFAT